MNNINLTCVRLITEFSGWRVQSVAASVFRVPQLLEPALPPGGRLV